MATRHSPARHDYQDLFAAGGAAALNAAIRERNPSPKLHNCESCSESRRRLWEVRWDSETGEGEVVGLKSKLPERH